MLKSKFFLCAAMLVAAAFAQGPGPGGREARGMGPGVRFLGGEAGRPGPVVTGAPYSAEAVTEITQSLADGNKIHQTNTTRIYRDSQGRTRREPALDALGSAAAGSSVPQLAFINDPVGGMSYVLDLAAHTATSTPLPPQGVRGPRDNRPPRPPSGSANVKNESLGRQILAGVPADGQRITVTIPAGQIGNAQLIQIVSESWYSPDLEVIVLSKRSDPRFGDTVFQLSGLSREEPPSTLFVVPADFQISPETRGMRMRNRIGRPPQ